MTKAERAESVARYRAARAELAALRERRKTVGKDFFKDECKRLFDGNPSLVDFGWRQYTPYFNDGEPCTFRCCTYDAMVNGRDPYTGDDPEDPSQYPELAEKEFGVLEKAVADFLGSFDKDEFLDWFGDHARVTVTRKGITVDRYDHD